MNRCLVVIEAEYFIIRHWHNERQGSIAMLGRFDYYVLSSFGPIGDHDCFRFVREYL
jgi:hypothetical protein